MKRNYRQTLIAISLFAICGVGFAGAQTSERERRRMQEAEERAQQAQAELQRALELMAEEQESDLAMERLDDAIQELQRARSRLGPRAVVSSYFDPVTDVFVSSSRRGAPQMGVYLNTERRPVTDSIGVVLNSVIEDGPAYEAGLREGDIITVANGEELARVGRGGMSPANKLIRIKEDLEEGDILSVEYRRGATTHSADMEVRYLDDYSFSINSFAQAGDFATAGPISILERDGTGFNISTSFSPRLALFGMLDAELIELDEELGWYFGVDEGLLVVRAPDDDEFLELRSGDVIVSIDGRRPVSQSRLMRILRSYEEGETMEISIMRQREAMTVEVTVPEREDSFRWRPGGRY